MDLLLDTHAVIWFITDDKKLPEKIKTQIENTKNDVLVSMVSLWEMSVKYSIGKLELDITLRRLLGLLRNQVL